MTTRTPLLVVALLALALPASAQPVRDSVRVLDPVVVTGTRVEVARSHVPLTVSRVDSAALARSGEPNVLPFISGRVPGVFVTERGVGGFGVARGAAGQITIRGIGSSPNTQVMVLVDGHPQFMGLYGHPLADTYLASGAERVEVVRGPASFLYGSGAMGGVLNVITRQARTEGLTGGVQTSLGSYTTRMLSGNAAWRQGRGGLAASVTHAGSDGHRPQSEYHLNGGSLRGDLSLRPGLTLTAEGGLTAFKTYDPGPTTAPYTDGAHWADIVRGRSSVTLANTSGRLSGALTAFHNAGDHDLYDGFQSKDFNTGVMAYQAVRLGATTLTLGGEYKAYGGRVGAVNRSMREAGGYAFVQQAIGARALLNAGLRLDHHSRFGSIAVPQAGFAVGVLRGLTVKGAVSRGFRSPSIGELYLFPTANDALRPERLWNYEAGLIGQTRRLSAELTVFVARADNLIQAEGTFPNLRFLNTGRLTNRGVELEAAWRGPAGLAAEASYSYLHRGRPLLAAPEHQAFGELRYTRGIATIGAAARHIAGLLPALRAPAEAYTLLDARLELRPIPALAWSVRAENLLDQRYQINAGYPMPGATVYTGLHLTF